MTSDDNEARVAMTPEDIWESMRCHGAYHSPSMPNPLALYRILGIYRCRLHLSVGRAVTTTLRRLKDGEPTKEQWGAALFSVAAAIEATRTRLHVDGANNITGLNGPAVYVSNHMSAVDTYMLPFLMCASSRVAIVAKDELFRLPIFGKLMREMRHISVSRTNAREDMKKILKVGAERIQEGKSVLIFPQSTRSIEFRAQEFNSMGVKLARRVGVNVVPVALKTDFLQPGALVKDLGPVVPGRDLRFRFGAPIVASGNGKEAHGQVIHFIEKTLAEWMPG